MSTNNGLLSFLFEVQSTPQVIDQVLDSQRIVDNKIKNLCELFINYSVRLILKRLQLVRNQLVNCSKIINNEGTFEDKGTRLANTTITSSTTQSVGQEEVKSLGETSSIENQNENQIETIELAAIKENVESVNVEKNKLSDETEEKNTKNDDLKTDCTTDVNKSTIADDTSLNEELHHPSDQQKEQLNSVQQLVNELNELIKEANEQVINVQKSMKIYLSSEDTEAILFKPVKNHIVKSIEALFSQLALVFGDQQFLTNNECQFSNAKIALESIFNTNRNLSNSN